VHRQDQVDHGQDVGDPIGRLTVDVDVALDAGGIVLHGQSHARPPVPTQPTDAQKLTCFAGGVAVSSRDVTLDP
jgi:hypothetical protein